MGNIWRHLCIILAFLPSAQADQDLLLAGFVTNAIHQKIAVGGADVAGSVSKRMVNAFTEGEEQAICGDYSHFLRTALKHVGIPTRAVQLASQDYIDGKNSAATHVSVEALIGDKLVVFDPTFNITLSCSDGSSYLSYAEARQCVSTGFSLIYSQLGTVESARAVQNYYIRYEDLINYTVSTAVNFYPHKYPVEGYPDTSWNIRAAKQY